MGSGKRQRAAAIRYMDHIDACHKLEQLTGDMRHGAVYRAGLKFVGIFPGRVRSTRARVKRRW